MTIDKTRSVRDDGDKEVLFNNAFHEGHSHGKLLGVGRSSMEEEASLALFREEKEDSGWGPVRPKVTM